MTKEQVSRYQAMLSECVSPHSVTTRLEQLGNAVRVIAVDQDWRWLQRAADRIKVGAQSVRNKRGRLQSPERLIAMGVTLIPEAETVGGQPPIARALLFREGLLIARTCSGIVWRPAWPSILQTRSRWSARCSGTAALRYQNGTTT